MSNFKSPNQIDFIILESLDSRRFNVKVNIAKMFNTIRGMIENCDMDDGKPVKLTVISAKALEKMVLYFKFFLKFLN